MSTFSIGDDGDDFAELRESKPAAPAAVKSASGNVTKLGAVPLKKPEPAKGELVSYFIHVPRRNPKFNFFIV